MRSWLQYVVLFLCITCGLAAPCRGESGLVIYAKSAIDFELEGYDGLESISISRGTLLAGERLNIATAYKGLAMLVFSGGQKYPVIISETSSVVTIASPDKRPSFHEGDENQLFYRLLTGDKSAEKKNTFAGLMIRGKELFDLSSSIQTVEELHGKKVEFQEFVKNNYRELSHSDLLRRLLAQYFMMHEYVSYPQEDIHGGGIRDRYQQEVLAGVKSWLTLLGEYVPVNEVLNYCVGLYYNRGMVTLASLIATEFEQIAYCSGEKQDQVEMPLNLKLTTSDGSAAGILAQFDKNTQKIFSFVSEECPVSMTMTVIKARELAASGNPVHNQILIVVPLEKLSEKHRAMNRNVSGGAMLFIDDEQWRRKNLQKIRLPLI